MDNLKVRINKINQRPNKLLKLNKDRDIYMKKKRIHFRLFKLLNYATIYIALDNRNFNGLRLTLLYNKASLKHLHSLTILLFYC